MDEWLNVPILIENEEQYQVLWDFWSQREVHVDGNQLRDINWKNRNYLILRQVEGNYELLHGFVANLNTQSVSPHFPAKTFIQFVSQPEFRKQKLNRIRYEK